MNKIKKIDYKPFILIIAMFLLQTLMYFGSKTFSSNAMLLDPVIDQDIPLVPWMVWFYVAWYVMLIVVPYIIYKYNKSNFYKLIITNFIVIVISNIVFICFPTYVIRPEVIVNSLSTWALNVIYINDTPAVNCLPSLHCALCILYIFFSFDKKIPKKYSIPIIVLSVLVILSTLFTKQHVTFDMYAALAVCIAIYGIVDNFKLYKWLEIKYEYLLRKIKY